MAQQYRKQKANQRAVYQEIIQGYVQRQNLRNLLTLGIFFGSLIIYLLTLSRTVAGGDSGELTTVAYTLGIAHPPGYPLYTLLGKLFSLIPIGKIAFRLNFMSAFFQSLSLCFLFRGTAHVTRDERVGLTAAGFFAFAPIPWTYSLAAEVFSLNSLFVTLLFYLFSRFLFDQDLAHAQGSPPRSEHRSTYAAFILFGIGLAHHHTLLLLGSPILLGFLYFWVRRGCKTSTVIRLLALSVAGFGLYAYLPLSSLRNPQMAWGKIASLDEFFTHFSRAEYGTFSLLQNDKSASFLRNIGFYLHDVFGPTLYIGLGLTLYGVYRSFKINRIWTITLLASHTLYLGVIVALSNIPEFPPVYRGILTRFWIAPSIFVSIWAALGLIQLLENCEGNCEGKFKIPKAGKWAICILACTQSIFFQYSKVDQSQNRTVDQFARALLQPLPPQSVLIVTNDVAYTATRYLQLCEDFRADVTVLPLELMSYLWFKDWAKKYVTEVTFPGDYYLPGKLDGYVASSSKYAGKTSYALVDFMRENVHRRPLYLTHLIKPIDDGPVEKEFSFLPFGFSFQIIPKDQVSQLNGKEAQAQSFKNLELFPVPPPGTFPDDSWEAYILGMRQDFFERTAKMIAH